MTQTPLAMSTTLPEGESEEKTPYTRALSLIIKGSPVVVGAAAATGCFYIGIHNPETHQVFAPCVFYSLTGFYCPGCGMTRALHNVVTGNLFRAFQFNAFLVIGFPIMMYLYVWWTTWAFTGKELPRIKMSRKITLAVLALAVIFVVGRNFPGSLPAFFAKDRV